MNSQNATQLHTTMREIMQQHLGEEMNTDDLIELLPESITAGYSDEDLYEIVDDYYYCGSQEDGFIVPFGPFLQDTILRRATKDCSYKLCDVIRIGFSIGNLFEGKSLLELIREPEGFVVKICRAAQYGDQKTETIVLEESKFNQVIAVLEEVNVLDWKDDYSALVLDGTEWGIILEFPEHMVFRSEGSNAYPKGFNRLLKEMIALGLPEEYHDYESDSSEIIE